MATDSGKSGNQKYSNENPGKETPEKFSKPAGPGGEGSGKYPNYWSYKSRSGHSLVFDDSKGEETVSLQHRSGSAVQMMPDGALHITAHNSKYSVTFGEDRVIISGAHDIVVKGDASMRVYGDYNVTCHKDYNLTVNGNFNMVAKNHNRHVRGNIDTKAKSENKKLEGSSTMTAQGAIAHTSKGSATLASLDQLHIGGSKGMNMQVGQGDITGNIEQGNFHFESKTGTFEAKMKDAIKFLSDSGAIHMIAQEAAKILAKNGNVNISSESGDVNMEASGKALVKGESVGIKGSSSAYVSGSTVSVRGTQSTNAGASETDMPSFSLLDSLKAVGKMGTAKAVTQPQEEQSEDPGWF